MTWNDPYNGGGTLCWWTAYGDDVVPAGDFLGDTIITVFMNEHTGAFVGLETDYPAAVLTHEALLRAQTYPLVDVLNAGLKDVHPADALVWGYHQLAAKGIETGSDVLSRLKQKGTHDPH